MSIAIYTYRDPYSLDKEPYWEEVKNCPYFCVSQTLVNGLKGIYRKDFSQGRVTTVQALISNLYTDWEATSTIVKQHTDIDNIITSGLPAILDNDRQENVSRAFLFNREEVFKSIRVMFELDMDTNDILEDKLTPEQKFILEIYKKILNSSSREDFYLQTDFSEFSLNDALNKAMESSKQGNELDVHSIVKDRIVIHGVHQFSPIMLRAIERLSKYKKVILLFNYQPQYKNTYQTWIDVYSAFDCNITDFEGMEFKPSLENLESYESNVLADNLGKLMNGQTKDLVLNNKPEILEFDNVTEFASYVANMFSKAEKINPESPMSVMPEQIYAADVAVNDILRIYFPEQFGERQFLDYPLGHFFLAIANMWDSQNNQILISDINDIKECLEAGILREEYSGQLSTIWRKSAVLFEGCTSVEGMLKRIQQLERNKRRLKDADETVKEQIGHISYYSVNKAEIARLKQALSDLNELASYFYEDFENQAHNFKEFYRRLKRYLQEEVLDSQNLGDEFTDIIRRVLDRLSEVEDIDASASFECLKATMSIYLKQETKPGKSANWIVRNFEQIDGDILRSKHAQETGKSVIYHFACLTDEDIDAVKRSDFPWPLTDDFFEVAQEPIDWKYQVYVRARKEYKNFKRYALLYGLEFNRSKYKLSFIRRDGEREREPYYLLRLLGVKRHPYEEYRAGMAVEEDTQPKCSGKNREKYNQYDFYRYRICNYRFLLETLIEGNTVYKDSFLLSKYLEVLLENQVKEKCAGLPLSETVLLEDLNETFDNLKKYFPFVLNAERMDIVNNIRRRLMGNRIKRFPELTKEEQRYMMIRELFIHKQLYDRVTSRKDVLNDKFPVVSAREIAEELSEEKLSGKKYLKAVDSWCQYCTNREICAAFYSY